MARKTARAKSRQVRTASGKARPKAARKLVKKKAKVAVRRAKPSAAKKSGASRKAPAEKSLGRPLVTAEEKLYMLFHEDYHARQIFEFLKVETVGELEQFSPQEIIRILSAPVRETVERIRAKLAANKRSLREDKEFARGFLEGKS